MAYKCLFLDNEVYTAQDVNDAISHIASGGVSGYPLGNGAMTDLNAAISELTSGGTDYHGTSCLVVNDGGVYKISEGVCIMNDGTQIVFDNDGYAIELEDGVRQYVYLERDVLNNTINVAVSQNSGGQDTIPLAEIDANGNIFDRRRFAKAKVSLAAEPQNTGITKSISFEINSGQSVAVDLGFAGWKYIIYYLNYYNKKIAFEFPDGTTMRNFPVGNNLPASYSEVAVTRNGSILEFEQTGGNTCTYNIDIEVR